MEHLSISELSLLIIASLTAGLYAKSENASSVLAAFIALGVGIGIYIITK